MVEQKVLFEKLTGFMDGKIPIDEIHAWVLKIALSSDYPQVAEQNPLIKETVQALMDLDRKELKFVPSRRILEYFRRCLEGKEEYLPPNKRRRLSHIIIDEPDKPASLLGRPSQVKTEKKKDDAVVRRQPKIDLFRLMQTCRRYTIAFAWCSFALHLVGAVVPEFFGFVVKESAIRLLIVALPHLIYALFIVMPIRVLAAGKVFLISFVLATFGAVVYCGMSVVFIVKFSLPLGFGLLVMPFAAIPSILMPIVLFYHRRLYLKALKEQEKSAEDQANSE